VLTLWMHTAGRGALNHHPLSAPCLLVTLLWLLEVGDRHMHTDRVRTGRVGGASLLTDNKLSKHNP
jgi:hypothetical protein